MPISDRVRAVEMREQADMIMVAADPDGVTSAALGTFAYDTVTDTLYVNTDGATAWDILSISGSVYGQIYVTTPAGVAVNNIGIANRVQMLIFDTDGPSQGTTPDHAQDHITILKTGVYQISVSCSAASANADDYETACYLNNGAVHLHVTHVHVNINNANRYISWSATGQFALTAGDTLELWLWRNTGPAIARTLTFEHAVMNCLLIGS